MNKGRNVLFLLIGIVSILAIVQFALAAHTIRTSSGGTSYFINEDVYTIFNFSVNNTDVLQTANITRVNVTLPSGFTFVSGSNLTSAGQHVFSNTSTVLSWTNTTSHLIMNLTSFYFSFNASAATPGNYNITITTLNATGSYMSNLSVVVNDTTVPSSVEFVDPTNASGANLSSSSLFANLTFVDNGVVGVATIRVFNTTGLVNATNSSSSPFSITFSLPNGRYQLNATVNDSFGNENVSVTRTITLDTTAPTANLTCDEESVNVDDELTCSCSGTDALSGVRSTSYTENPDTDETGTFTTTCTVTDYSGNTATSDFEYTVDNSRRSGDSGAGSSTSTTTWTNTVRSDDAELSTKGDVRSTLSVRQRVQIRVGGDTHHVGVKSITTTSAVIEIASTPQQVTFNTGETKKFDLDEDNYYDMEVTLESIESSRATVVIRALHEQISAATTTTEPVVTTAESESAGGGSAIWLGIVLALAIIAVVVYFFMRYKNQHKHD